MIDWDNVDYKKFEIQDCDKGTGYPKYYNAFIYACDYDGVEMTEEELEQMDEQLVAELIWDYYN